jgi:hypothetical protein
MKAWLNFPPDAMLPELNSPLLSLVTVWVVAPLFVQVTVTPESTVIEAGLKAKSTIETELVDGGGEGEVGLLDLLHPCARRKTAKTKTRASKLRKNFLSILNHLL